MKRLLFAGLGVVGVALLLPTLLSGGKTVVSGSAGSNIPQIITLGSTETGESKKDGTTVYNTTYNFPEEKVSFPSGSSQVESLGSVATKKESEPTGGSAGKLVWGLPTSSGGFEAGATTFSETLGYRYSLNPETKKVINWGWW